jgi:hypothetical protein
VYKGFLKNIFNGALNKFSTYSLIKTMLPLTLSASPAHHHFSLGHSLESGWTESSSNAETSANHLVQDFSQFMHLLFLSNNQ